MKNNPRWLSLVLAMAVVFVFTGVVCFSFSMDMAHDGMVMSRCISNADAAPAPFCIMSLAADVVFGDHVGALPSNVYSALLVIFFVGSSRIYRFRYILLLWVHRWRTVLYRAHLSIPLYIITLFSRGTLHPKLF